jgi:hypothetical protein
MNAGPRRDLSLSARLAAASNGREAQRARVDWRLPFLAVLVVVAIAFWTVWKTLPETPRPASQADARPSTMGPLEPKTNRQGRDLSIGGELSGSAAECARLCDAHNRCKAMSYSAGTSGELGRCWLKESVPAATPNDLMTSAVKLHAASAP